MSDANAAPAIVRARRRVVIISALATFVTLIGCGVLVAVVDSRGFASPEDAVRAACHPATVIRVLPQGVMWEPSASDPGTGWIASIDRRFGARYVVRDCRSSGFTHG